MCTSQCQDKLFFDSGMRISRHGQDRDSELMETLWTATINYSGSISASTIGAKSYRKIAAASNKSLVMIMGTKALIFQYIRC
jgi:hypothetical protein